MRSSSWAQTAASHVTTRVPPRSAVGVGVRGHELADGRRPGPLDVGQQGLRRERVRQRLDRAAGRPRRVASARHDAAATGSDARSTRPPSTRRRVASAARSPGTWPEVGRRHEGLTGGVEMREQPLASGRVELGQDVVEEEQRGRAPLRGQRVALGQEEREEREALLALRPVGAQLAPVAQQGEVVAVRAVAGEAPLEVRRQPLGQLVGELLRGRGARPRSVAELRGAGQPEVRRERGEALLQERHGARAVVAQGEGVAGELEVPGAQRVAGRRRPCAGGRAARCAGPAPARRRGGGRSAPARDRSRPGRGGRDARAGAPLTSSRRSGRKTATSGRDGASRRRSTGAPSAFRRLGSPGWKPTLSPWGPSSSCRSTSTRVAPAPNRTTSRSFVVRHERPVQPKYSASRRFVLPAPLGPCTIVSRSPRATSAAA